MRSLSIRNSAALALVCLGLSLPAASTAADDAPPAAAPISPAGATPATTPPPAVDAPTVPVTTDHPEAPPPVQVDLAQLFPAGVTFGEPLPWRELGPQGNPAIAGDHIFAGHFDDSGSEMLMVGGFDRWRFFRADGTEVQALEDHSLNLSRSIVCLWDYDGDGIDDAVCRETYKSLPDNSPSRFNPDQALVAYNISGSKLGVIQQGDVSPEPVLCDLDGDGKTDLLVRQATSDSPADVVWTGFGVGAQQLFTAGQNHQPFPFGFVADVEGTGRDVLVGAISNSRYLEYGVGRAGATLPTSVAKLLDRPSLGGFSISLEGHGLDTVIGELYGRYIDLRRSAIYTLDPPPGLDPPEKYMDEPGPWAQMMLVDDDGHHLLTAFHQHGQSRLAGIARPWLDSGRTGFGADIFCIWQRNGQLQYAENLGELGWQVLALHACDGDHVVLLTESRLLIWP